ATKPQKIPPPRGNCSEKTMASIGSSIRPTACIRITTEYSLVRFEAKPPPKSAAPHAAAEARPKRMTRNSAGIILVTPDKASGLSG
ncbi:hypothetical protein, partial [Methanococcoides sp.]|uniref:hypothetical protein n=1 Tax=Methanococcoides sp. TaxID=1966350 RepID=UPI00272E35B7